MSGETTFNPTDRLAALEAKVNALEKTNDSPNCHFEAQSNGESPIHRWLETL